MTCATRHLSNSSEPSNAVVTDAANFVGADASGMEPIEILGGACATANAWGQHRRRLSAGKPGLFSTTMLLADASPFLEPALGAFTGALVSLVGVFPWLFQRRIEALLRRQEGRWTRWDERHADAIQACNGSLAELHMACAVAFGRPEDPDALAAGQDASRRFTLAVHQTQIFFDKALIDRLDEVRKHAWDVLNSLRMRQRPEDWDTADTHRENYEKAYSALNRLSEDLNGKLRTDFQALLKTDDSSPSQ